MTTKNHYYGTGRRKSSIARVFLQPGGGSITINSLNLEKYFGRETLRMTVHQPFTATGLSGKFDVMATVKGGGNSSQAGAIRLGIARAIVLYDKQTSNSSANTDAENSLALRKVLRDAGFLTRDARVVERKKVGRHKARRGTQYSKR